MASRIGLMTFSPTHTTRQICSAVASGMGARDKEPGVFDITQPQIRNNMISHQYDILKDIDTLIVGSPVHSGKLPAQAIECLQALDGKGKEAIAIAVYGNRDYGIALFTMADLLAGNGFKITAAGAFIGQHSYSDIVPVALGRPDELDIEKARRLGRQSRGALAYLDPADIPRQYDSIAKSKEYTAIKPVFKAKLCQQCGNCSRQCPLGLLSAETGRYFEQAARAKCIGCMACTRACPNQAKIVRVNPLVAFFMKRILKQAIRERKEPLIILS